MYTRTVDLASLWSTEFCNLDIAWSSYKILVLSWEDVVASTTVFVSKMQRTSTPKLVTHSDITRSLYTDSALTKAYKQDGGHVE
ncbi:uncharacterized protein [Dysidea avara]|uniref:uncharacterized protein isoform X3 n=1 Tax=Dysidea avara TaxID=196820 RepID=UPI003330AEAD